MGLLKKTKKGFGKVVSAPVKIATNAANGTASLIRNPGEQLKQIGREAGRVSAAPTKLIGQELEAGLDEIGLRSVGRIAAKPFNLTSQGIEAVAKTPYSFSSGLLNLAENPGQQTKQIGREAGRTATSPLLPIAAGFVPGIGPALAAGIGAAQGAYAGRKGGLDDALLGAAIGGGTSYLGARGAQSLLGSAGLLAPTAASTAGAGFNLGTGTGSIASGIPGLSSYAAPVASGFNLGTGAGSILGGSAALGAAGLGQFAAPAATGFNLASGTGSIANSAGLGLSDAATQAASDGANLLNPAEPGFGIGDALNTARQGVSTTNRIDAAVKPQRGLLGLGAVGLAGLGLGQLSGGNGLAQPMLPPDYRKSSAFNNADQYAGNFNPQFESLFGQQQINALKGQLQGFGQSVQAKPLFFPPSIR